MRIGFISKRKMLLNHHFRQLAGCGPKNVLCLKTLPPNTTFSYVAILQIFSSMVAPLPISWWWLIIYHEAPTYGSMIVTDHSTQDLTPIPLTNWRINLRTLTGKVTHQYSTAVRSDLDEVEFELVSYVAALARF
jgi:hypothetical protein